MTTDDLVRCGVQVASIAELFDMVHVRDAKMWCYGHMRHAYKK
jgi:hypothetical protein